MKPSPIRIEPRKIYDKAITAYLPDGRAVYSYYRLIKVTAAAYFKGSDTAEEDAQD